MLIYDWKYIYIYIKLNILVFDKLQYQTTKIPKHLLNTKILQHPKLAGLPNYPYLIHL